MVMVEVPAPTGLLTTYVAEPADRGPRPGVVVVHDVVVTGRCSTRSRRSAAG
jgi:dienelactone hydrolase